MSTQSDFLALIQTAKGGKSLEYITERQTSVHTLLSSKPTSKFGTSAIHLNSDINCRSKCPGIPKMLHYLNKVYSKIFMIQYLFIYTILNNKLTGMTEMNKKN